MSKGIASVQTHLTEIFRVLDPLRDLLNENLNGWESPVIVVFGDESSPFIRIERRKLSTPMI